MRENSEESSTEKGAPAYGGVTVELRAATLTGGCSCWERGLGAARHTGGRGRDKARGAVSGQGISYCTGYQRWWCAAR